MGSWRTNRVTDEFRELVNIDTGALRRVPFASDKQFNYLQSLREQAGKPPLKNRPAAYAAAKAIDKLLAKKSKDEEQQQLI